MFELDKLEMQLMLPFLGTMAALSLLVVAGFFCGARRARAEAAE